MNDRYTNLAVVDLDTRIFADFFVAPFVRAGSTEAVDTVTPGRGAGLSEVEQGREKFSSGEAAEAEDASVACISSREPPRMMDGATVSVVVATRVDSPGLGGVNVGCRTVVVPINPERGFLSSMATI